MARKSVIAIACIVYASWLQLDEWKKKHVPQGWAHITIEPLSGSTYAECGRPVYGKKEIN